MKTNNSNQITNQITNSISKVIEFITSPLDYSITPKGKLLNHHIKTNDEQTEHYKTTEQELENYLIECALLDEEKFLNKPFKKVKLYNVTILFCEKDTYWYEKLIGKTFTVYDYNRKQYSLMGENFGFLISKKDCGVNYQVKEVKY